MFTIERRDKIKALLLEKQSVQVSELSKLYDVSYETIRRDFDAMEQEGFLTRTYGGAVLKKHVQREVQYDVLSTLFLENKRRIADEAIKHISANDCIFLDHSTTAFQLISRIEDIKLTVMTNSLKALSKLSESKSNTLVSTGGILNKDLYCFLGSTAEKTVKNFHMDKAFISCGSIDMQHGICDKFEQVADMRRSIINNAESVYLLMDYTKFDKITFAKICDVDRITAVITDHKLPCKWVEYFKSQAIEYYEARK